jgi:hypothetical protein
MAPNTARALDQFYTNQTVAKQCIAFLKVHVRKKNIFYVEPSAGAGAFLNELPTRSRLGLDIDPRHNSIHKQDFLEFNPETLPENRVIITIGNPPFGKNASLAIKFLNKAAEYSAYIAFILPKTFKKESTAHKINKNLHLIAELELGKNSFNFQGNAYDVPCVFQIWEKRSQPRNQEKSALSCADFEFTTQDKAKFAVRRVGGLAGKIITDFSGYSPASHYYIRPLKDACCCLLVFKAVDWSHVKFNTAGNPSISKRELIALYTETKTRICDLPTSNQGES